MTKVNNYLSFIFSVLATSENLNYHKNFRSQKSFDFNLRKFELKLQTLAALISCMFNEFK